jgi:lysophospholipid acyltransferase
MIYFSHLKSAVLSDNVRFDETSPMMVIVIKLTSFAWSVYDGTQDVSLLSEEQKHARIETMPSLLEFLGYIYFFPGFLVGPALEFTDYQKFIHQSVRFFLIHGIASI